MDISGLFGKLSFTTLKFQFFDEDVEVSGVAGVIAAIIGEMISATRVTESYSAAFVGGQ